MIKKRGLNLQTLFTYFHKIITYNPKLLNGVIKEATLTRMENTLERPIRRGLDKAMNECMDKLEANSEPTKNGKVDCLCNETKRILEEEKV